MRLLFNELVKEGIPFLLWSDLRMEDHMSKLVCAIVSRSCAAYIIDIYSYEGTLQMSRIETESILLV